MKVKVEVEETFERVNRLNRHEPPTLKWERSINTFNFNHAQKIVRPSPRGNYSYACAASTSPAATPHIDEAEHLGVDI
ncbi:hypothetical protein [Methylocystis echinoides]|uniref:Uncharacterized protein n=1 Tax=Methylocystis echinoides TaxID=29468 RepID=A0A9W6GYT5_9HYPH|nr:hypothetical protein [Methylocystis echinoides]GLI95593.1 hypothetical protein LMG27198_45850 [Methylocystis echinoides]